MWVGLGLGEIFLVFFLWFSRVFSFVLWVFNGSLFFFEGSLRVL